MISLTQSDLRASQILKITKMSQIHSNLMNILTEIYTGKWCPALYNGSEIALSQQNYSHPFPKPQVRSIFTFFEGIEAFL